MEAGARVRTAEGAEGTIERLRGRDARVQLDNGRGVWRKKDSLVPVGSNSAPAHVSTAAPQPQSPQSPDPPPSQRAPPPPPLPRQINLHVQVPELLPVWS